ncbi:TetR/AcrR family transcriptional regulator C-terminal domain-containing protein [Patulibacter minatonensis]|uniref:TetR/AcrR family transcriptional regulator C-terminal domain-containing protein n=1 Tax=Patulibacter minatonensis TaxID=298163 RepID=UPI00047DE20E|nr:TetR/AcrR family transcriptional regulator C-terminal domain-containing protein [Patulibacter minatonensis]
MPVAEDRSRRDGPLSRTAVLDAAIALVERDGANALTMRRLGAELGVEAMSLYHHVPNRDAVLSGMAERLMSQLQPPPKGAGWQDAGEWFARQLRIVATSSPQTFALTAMRPLLETRALEPVEALLAALVRAGASPADALMAYRALASYARGYALAEVAGFTVDATSADGEGALGALDTDAFPILAGRRDELRDVRADRAFDVGLEALIAGLSATLVR